MSISVNIVSLEPQPNFSYTSPNLSILSALTVPTVVLYIPTRELLIARASTEIRSGFVTLSNTSKALVAGAREKTSIPVRSCMFVTSTSVFNPVRTVIGRSVEGAKAAGTSIERSLPN